MKLDKRQLAIIALVVVLVTINIALAVLYMTKDVDITGGVSVIGSIEVYDDDGTTELTSYEFANFTGGQPATAFKNFFINNTGNQPVYVYWSFSNSSITWLGNEFGYAYYEDITLKYNYGIATSWLPDPYDYWSPIHSATPEALYLDVGEGKELQIVHQYTGSPNTDESYSLVMSFYAEDA